MIRLSGILFSSRSDTIIGNSRFESQYCVHANLLGMRMTSRGHWPLPALLPETRTLATNRSRQKMIGMS